MTQNKEVGNYRELGLDPTGGDISPDAIAGDSEPPCCTHLELRQSTDRRGGAERQLDTTDMHAANYVVAVVDVLGQQARMRKFPLLPSDGSARKEVECLAKDTVGIVLNYRERLREAFERYSRWDESLLQLIPRDARDLFRGDFRVVTHGFSDTIVCGVQLGRGPDPDAQDPVAIVVPVFSLLTAVGVLVTHSLACGYPIRGGIDLGIAFPLSETELYGPALARAHILESRVAEYPRVVIGSELIQFLASWKNLEPTRMHDSVAMHIANKCLAKVAIDSDKVPMLDFLGPAFSPATPPDDMALQVRDAYSFVSSELSKHRASSNAKLSDRYRRLDEYFRKHLPAWGIVGGATRP